VHLPNSPLPSREAAGGRGHTRPHCPNLCRIAGTCT
jgi:hypothetical protein